MSEKTKEKPIKSLEEQFAERKEIAKEKCEKYKELYKDNSVLLSVLTVDNVSVALDKLARNHGSFKLLDKFLKELNEISEERITHRRNLVVLTENSSNLGAEKALRNYCPKIARIPGTQAYDGETPFDSILYNYIRNKFEEITHETAHHAVACYEAEHYDLDKKLQEDENENHDALLESAFRIPYLHVKFSESVFKDVLVHSYELGNLDYTKRMLELHPEFTDKVADLADRSLKKLEKERDFYPKEFSWNDGEVKHHDWFDNNIKTIIGSLNDILDYCEPKQKTVSRT